MEQPDSSNLQQVMIILEVVPENPQDADTALVNAVGNDAFDALVNDSFTIQPIYTGRKGVPIVEVITYVTDIATFLMTHKDAVDILAALVTILSPVASIAIYVRNAYEKRVGKEAAQQQPVKISVEIDGVSIQVETAAPKDAKEIAVELAKQLQANHPNVVAGVINQGRAKLKVGVPKQPQRRRR